MAYRWLVLCFLIGAAPLRGDFNRDVAGFLKKHCLACHGASKPKGDLNLAAFHDKTALLKNRKVWQDVLNQVETGQMPPAKRPRPGALELAAFGKAVRLVFDQADRGTPPDPGRVTARRLNRTEYNNTIRDLVGVDFNPAEDFPADDIGHGFDNIGDVLSLSPVLMERYLAAAESIVQRAIMVDVPKPAVRTLNSRWLSPGLKKDPTGRFRPVGKKSDMLSTQFHPTVGGEFLFGTRAYTAATKEKLRIAMVVDGKELQSFDVSATEKDPAKFQVKLPLPAGVHNFAVKMLNDKVDPGTKDVRSVLIEYLQLTGPLDPRPASHRTLLRCDGSKPQAQQTREVLTRFANRAYRRPASAGEIDRLVDLAQGVVARGGKWEAGIRLAVEAVLVSPKFLFRLEVDSQPEKAGPHALDEYQLASRLSYFLWSTMPDEELFALAAKRQLGASLEAQVRRMLKDPRAHSLVDDFAMQWLQLQRLKTFSPDPTLFKFFSEELRDSMFKETELFLEAIIKEDRSILELIDADFTFLNERLAWHYAILDTAGNPVGGRKPKGKPGQVIRGGEFQRVHLRDKERGGLLTMGSILSVTSNPTRTSPVKRGKWLLEQILGTPPPPPPPDVPDLDNPKKQLTGTLRQRMEQHRAIARCAGCHARMDPLGFAFENYNAMGSFRLEDEGQPIDASGTLPDGRSFKGAEELKSVLLEKKDLFVRCLTEKLLTYALGRGLEPYDRRAVERITAAVTRDHFKFSSLAVEIAKSEPFRLRRGRRGIEDGGLKIEDGGEGHAGRRKLRKDGEQ